MRYPHPGEKKVEKSLEIHPNAKKFRDSPNIKNSSRQAGWSLKSCSHLTGFVGERTHFLLKGSNLSSGHEMRFASPGTQPS